MAEPRLQEGESVLYTTHPSGWALSIVYFFTLGLYHFWRQATYFLVTDRRVIKAKGIVAKVQRNVPLDMLQDASLQTTLGMGAVVLSSAGGRLSVEQLNPLKASTAREMVDAILHARQQVRRSSINPDSDVMGKLKQLGELRESGVLSAEEFAAKKAELLGRL